MFVVRDYEAGASTQSSTRTSQELDNSFYCIPLRLESNVFFLEGFTPAGLDRPTWLSVVLYEAASSPAVKSQKNRLFTFAVAADCWIQAGLYSPPRFGALGVTD